MKKPMNTAAAEHQCRPANHEPCPEKHSAVTGLELRPYRSADLPQILELFSATVRIVNAGDYSPAQIDAWVGGVDARRWDETLSAHYTLVAWADGQIVGFADLDGPYLDRLYVHKDYQGRGVATALCRALEHRAGKMGVHRLITHASITAKPFFEGRGYLVERKQRVERNKILMENFVMSKANMPL